MHYTSFLSMNFKTCRVRIFKSYGMQLIGIAQSPRLVSTTQPRYLIVSNILQLLHFQQRFCSKCYEISFIDRYRPPCSRHRFPNVFSANKRVFPSKIIQLGSKASGARFYLTRSRAQPIEIKASALFLCAIIFKQCVEKNID